MTDSQWFVSTWRIQQWSQNLVRSLGLASIATYHSTSYSLLDALMTNAVVHSMQTGSGYFQIDSFLLQFSSDKILEAQLFHRLAQSKQLIVMLIYGNAYL